MCVCVSLSLSEFQKCPSHFILSYNFTQREKEKKRFDKSSLLLPQQKSSSSFLQKVKKVVFVIVVVSKCVVVCGGKFCASKAIILLVVLKVLFFWRLLIRCSKVFLVLCLFSLFLFFVSLSRLGGPFFLLFLSKP